MTAVRTRVQAGCFAVTASSQQLLVIDRFKKITVASVDQFTPLFSKMNLSEQKEIATEHLVNACIIYAMSTELGIPPGLFITGDKAIVEFCRSQISQDVDPDSHDILIKELIDSWQQISAHPLLKKYLQLGEFLTSESIFCQFTPMGAFEFFVHDYFAGCLRAFFNNDSQEVELLKQWTFLIFANLDRKGMRHNRFWQAEVFLEKVTLIINETGNTKQLVDTFIGKFKKEHDMFNAMWFVTVKNWTLLELDEIETLPDVAVGLTDLLEGQLSTGLSEDIEQQLVELRRQRFWQSETDLCPLIKQCDFGEVAVNTKAKNELMKEIISYTICSFANQNKIVLYPVPLDPLPLYRLSGKGEQAEEKLMQGLLDDEVCLKLLPFELFAIVNKAKNKALQDCAREAITARAKSEEFFSVLHSFQHMSIGALAIQGLPSPTSALTYQFRRLKTLVNGAPISVMRKEASPAQLAQENPAADALYEALNLEKPNQFCVIQ